MSQITILTLILSRFNDKNIDDDRYKTTVKKKSSRDTLAFGNKVCRDAIVLGNTCTLTIKQVYNLAKAEESTKAQMKITT